MTDQEAAEKYAPDHENPTEIGDKLRMAARDGFLAGVEHARNNPVVSESLDFEQWITSQFPGKGPCLVAKPGTNLPNCHENDFCKCDMQDAFDFGSFCERAKLAKVKEALENIAALHLSDDLIGKPGSTTYTDTMVAREALKLLDGKEK